MTKLTCFVLSELTATVRTASFKSDDLNKLKKNLCLFLNKINYLNTAFGEYYQNSLN